MARSQPTFVVDTNIFIDLHRGGLLDAVFQLPFCFVAPDVIIEELKSPRGSDLLASGVVSVELTGAQVREVSGFAGDNPSPSINDLFAFVAARAMRCALLTGDKALRKLALQMNVKVGGTLWLLDEMVRRGILDPAAASTALTRMIDSGSRLPRIECKKRLEAWNA